MLNKKNGYTLAEVMVAITLISVLASVMLPTVSRVRPNRDKMLFKKAYYITERVVYELVNDEDIYPEKTGKYYGLDNTSLASFGAVDYGGDADADAKTKFCGLFARKVNLAGHISGSNNTIKCANIAYIPEGGGTFSTPTFTTSDGIAWYMPITKFEKDEDGSPSAALIYVDVNGAKEPNCMEALDCQKPDIFRIHVQSDGKVFVAATGKEAQFLRSSDNTR